MKQNRGIQSTVLLFLLLLSCFSQKHYRIRSGDVVFLLDAGKSFITINRKDQKTALTLTALNQVPGFYRRSTQWQNNGANVEHHSVFTDSLGRTLTCLEKFSAAPGGLNWQVEWSAQSEKTFTVPLQTVCTAWEANSARFWTAWGDPRQTSPVEKASVLWKEWCDPLEAQNFRDMHLIYGGHFSLGGGFSLPGFSVLYPNQDAAWSLVQSPLDTLLNLDLVTSAVGRCTLSRTDYRLQKGKTIRYTLNLITHAADWRPALAWMVERYPGYFNPPNPHAGQVAGCGLYSSYEGEFDVAKFHHMGGLVNWKASFDFPYMGMFIPPLQDRKQQWRRFKIDPKQPNTYTSIEQMARYATTMRQKGFHVLNYFNVTEFGADIKYPAPIADYQGKELWQDANAFLYKNLHNAILFAAQQNGTSWGGWGSRTAEQQLRPQPGLQKKPYYTWGAALVTDCADSAYADFLVEQAQRHLSRFPDADGICIDRMDWLAEYNSRRDDGISWIDDRPAASLYFSWQSLLDRMGPLWHNADKVIFCNPHLNRLELMNQIDGIYNEFGHIGFNLNMSAFLAIHKPLLAWTAGVQDLKSDPDGYLQHHLYMGAFPTAPFPGNDHTIEPDPWVEKYYLDYGPLFSLLKGKKWLLTPHAITVKDGAAKANIFEADAGYVIPIIHGKKPNVQIVIKEILPAEIATCQARYPGNIPSVPLTGHIDTDGLVFNVPLQRNCAMVVITTKKREPEGR